MNVALTRAKRAVWVVGNARTLRRNKDWGAFLAYLKKIQCPWLTVDIPDDVLRHVRAAGPATGQQQQQLAARKAGSNSVAADKLPLAAASGSRQKKRAVGQPAAPATAAKQSKAGWSSTSAPPRQQLAARRPEPRGPPPLPLPASSAGGRELQRDGDRLPERKLPGASKNKRPAAAAAAPAAKRLRPTAGGAVAAAAGPLGAKLLATMNALDAKGKPELRGTILGAS